MLHRAAVSAARPHPQESRPSAIAVDSLDSFTMLNSLFQYLSLSRLGSFDDLLLLLLLFIIFTDFPVTMGYPDTTADFYERPTQLASPTLVVVEVTMDCIQFTRSIRD